MPFEQIANNIKAIDEWEVLCEIIEKKLGRIIELNKKQLSEGDFADGTSTPSYSGSPMSEIYIDQKIERGAYLESLYPHMNFYNFGDFYRGITARIVEKGITIWSEDDKDEEIEEKYGGTRLFGLTDENFELFVDETIGEYQDLLTIKILL
jgi:hypothetical protein